MSRGRILALGLCLGCFASAALPASRVQQLLARAKAASGGAAWDRIPSIRSAGTLDTSGLKGTFETLEDLRSGAHVERFDLGVQRGADGFDGRSAWVEDAAGHVYPQGGEARRRQAVDEAYLACRGYWFPSRWPADVAWMGDRKEAGRTFQVLQIEPLGGQPFEFWLDAATGLPDRTVVFDAEGGRQITRFADYRDVKGLKLPFAIREGDGQALFDTVQHVRRVDLDAGLAPDAFAPPAQPKDEAGFASGLRRANLPIVVSSAGHVYLQASLDGKGPLWFTLDSGWEGNALSSEAASRLGLDAKGAVALSGAGGTIERAGFAKVSRVQVQGAWMRGVPFAVSQAVSSIGSVQGQPCVGVLGSDFFQRFTVRIEYAAHRLSLLPEGAPPDRHWGRAVPFSFAGQIPVAAGALDGMRGLFRIDSGSGSTLDVFAPFVKVHDLVARAGRTYPSPGEDHGIGGGIFGRVARFGSLSLGPVSMTHPLVGLSQMAQGAFATMDGLGNLGAGFLKRFDVTFDNRHQRLYLEPNANHDLPDRFGNTHGLTALQPVKGGFRITGLLSPSPLAAAGVQVGDGLVSLDGKSGRDLLPALETALHAPVGTKVVFGVAHGGKVRQVPIVLKELL